MKLTALGHRFARKSRLPVAVTFARANAPRPAAYAGRSTDDPQDEWWHPAHLESASASTSQLHYILEAGFQGLPQFFERAALARRSVIFTVDF